MKPWRTLVLVLVIAGLTASVSACGRKGAPERLEGEEDRKEYPTH